MRIMIMASLALALLAGCAAQDVTAPETTSAEMVAGHQIMFTAADGEVVYAERFDSDAGKSAPLILLFHQAGANGRAEYESIIPELRARGFNLIVADQRSGGSHFGGHNRTVEARGQSTQYCAAYPDLEAALSYAIAEGFDGPRFAWGSSYSAGLVLKLAVEHGNELAGILSFSPASGAAMGACSANNYISKVRIPAIGLRPDSEMNAGGRAQRVMFEEGGHEFYVAEKGVHGSSMLDPSRAHGDVVPTWKAVWAFLDAHTN